MTITEIKAATGMTQQQLADHLGIPKRTIENWCTGVNACPDYVLSLIEYRLRNEGLLK